MTTFLLWHFSSRFIHSTNRKGLTYKVKVNHLADQTPDELRKLRGKKKSDGKYNGGKEFRPVLKPDEIPETMNWRLFGKFSLYANGAFVKGQSKSRAQKSVNSFLGK